MVITGHSSSERRGTLSQGGDIQDVTEGQVASSGHLRQSF